MLKLVRRESRGSLFEDIAARLRDLIYSHELRPGDPIDEPALCGKLGVSRTPLREALKVLYNEGLVRLVPRRGAFVTKLSSHELEQLFPVMALLEGRCAFETTRRLQQHEMDDLEKLHADLEACAAANDISGYYQVNYIFHDRVHQLTGNLWLTQVTQDLHKFLRLGRGRQLRLPGRLAASLSEHHALMHALRHRDAEQAERIMHQHLLNQRDAFKSLEKLLAELQGT